MLVSFQYRPSWLLERIRKTLVGAYGRNKHQNLDTVQKHGPRRACSWLGDVAAKMAGGGRKKASDLPVQEKPTARGGCAELLCWPRALADEAFGLRLTGKVSRARPVFSSHAQARRDLARGCEGPGRHGASHSRGLRRSAGPGRGGGLGETGAGRRRRDVLAEGTEEQTGLAFATNCELQGAS